MHKIFLTLIICSCSLSSLYGQDTIFACAYKTSRDFLQRNPYLKTSFVLEKFKRDSAIYKVHSGANAEKNETSKTSIWGFYNDTTLYLNCLRLGMDNGFVKIKLLGKYAYFIGRSIANAEQERRMTYTGVLFGIAGSLLSQAQVRRENKDKIHYVINLETGVCNLLGNFAQTDHLISD